MLGRKRFVRSPFCVLSKFFLVLRKTKLDYSTLVRGNFFQKSESVWIPCVLVS